MQEAVPTLSQLLQNSRVRDRTDDVGDLANHLQEKALLESAVLAFARMVDVLCGSQACLLRLAEHGLMVACLPLVLDSPPLLDRKMLPAVLKMLTKLCARAPKLAEPLIARGIASMLRCVRATCSAR